MTDLDTHARLRLLDFPDCDCEVFAACDCDSESCQVLFHLEPLCEHCQGYDHGISLDDWAHLLLEHDAEEYEEPLEPEPAIGQTRAEWVEIMAQRQAAGIGLHNVDDSWNRLRPHLAMPALPPRSGFGKHSAVIQGDVFVERHYRKSA